MGDATFPVRPIGVVHCPGVGKGDLPRQSGLGAGPEATVELDPSIPPESLSDLEGFDRIWLLAWLDRAEGWNPRVRPPRGDAKRGVFATRAPHRPNPIGLSCVRLVAVEGRTLHIADHDLLDGTPVLDVKPYLPYSDAHSEASAGWAEEGWRRWRVEMEPSAEERCAWLAERSVPLVERLRSVLSLRPEPAPGHRVVREPDDTLVWAWRTWRVIYRCSTEAEAGEPPRVTVHTVRSGFDPDETPVGDQRDAPALHRAFRDRFGV